MLILYISTFSWFLAAIIFCGTSVEYGNGTNGQGQAARGTEIADPLKPRPNFEKHLGRGDKTMTKMKKLAAVMMLAAVMTMGATQAKAGFILTGFAEDPTETTVKTDDTGTTDPNAASDTDVTVLDGIILTLEGILMTD